MTIIELNKKLTDLIAENPTMANYPIELEHENNCSELDWLDGNVELVIKDIVWRFGSPSAFVIKVSIETLH